MNGKKCRFTAQKSKTENNDEIDNMINIISGIFEQYKEQFSVLSSFSLQVVMETNIFRKQL